MVVALNLINHRVRPNTEVRPLHSRS
jgi:hypothetical protein